MKASRLLSLFQVAILLFLLCAGSNETTNSNAQNGFDYEYSNAKGQSFSFHCSNSNVTVYEKTVNDLISEWNSNVALAEKRVSVLMGDAVEPRKNWINENVVFTLEDDYKI